MGGFFFGAGFGGFASLAILADAAWPPAQRA